MFKTSHFITTVYLFKHCDYVSFILKNDFEMEVVTGNEIR